MATQTRSEPDQGDRPSAFNPGLAHSGRERAIPIRPGDLDRLLRSDPALTEGEGRLLARFGRLLGAVFHHEFFEWLGSLKELYAPIDPDADAVSIAGASPSADRTSDEAFLGALEATLVRANYRALDFRTLEEAIASPNEHGLSYIPNFKLFEHLRVYVRGEVKVAREVRTLKSRFRKTTVSFDGYRRMIIALKFRDGVSLGEYVKGSVVYLRMYKDVPKVDLEMHLPEQGTRVRMRLMDKAQIASPLAIGLPTFGLKLVGMAAITGFLSPATIGGLLAMPITASLKSFFGFRRARQNHMARMVRHLYYLTLANNMSVITRLVDAAEEEEYKEALLAYHYLRLAADDPLGCTASQLDERIEAFLRERTGQAIDFEVKDALAKLLRLGLAQEDGAGRLYAIPPRRALAVLDEQWDRYFPYSDADAAAADDAGPGGGLDAGPRVPDRIQ